MDFGRRFCCAALVVTPLLADCRADLPGDYLGESAHFRLYVDPELRLLHPTFTAENGLAALADITGLLPSLLLSFVHGSTGPRSF